MGRTKCSSCDSPVLSLNVKAVDGNLSPTRKLLCIVLCCPRCGAVLGAQVDPIAVKTDIVNALKK